MRRTQRILGMFPRGATFQLERTIAPEWTIAHYDPQLPPVLSTPAMIGLMEIAAALAVQPYLPAGKITVGTRILVDHLQAAGVGDHLQVRARLKGRRGKFLVFDVEANAGRRVLGRGEVCRAVVDLQRFVAGLAKAPRSTTSPRAAE